jgi:hypothetical protein
MHKSTLQVLTFKRLDEKKKEKKMQIICICSCWLSNCLAMELVSAVEGKVLESFQRSQMLGWAGRVTPPITA